MNFSSSKVKGTLNFNQAEFGISKNLLEAIKTVSPEEIQKKYGLSLNSIAMIKNLKPDQINNGCVTFEGAEIDGAAIFNQMQIHLKEVDFREVNFYKKLEFKIEDRFLEKVSMVETYIYDLMGDRGRVGGQTDPNNKEPRGIIERLERRNKGQRYLRLKPPFINLHEIRKRIVKKAFPYRPKLYRYLSEKFNPILGDKAEARYPIAAKDIKDDRFLFRFKDRHKFLFYLWWLFADCGRSFKRWAGWSLAIALLFAVIFTPPRDLIPDFLGIDSWISDWWVNISNDIGPCFEQTTKNYGGEPLTFWSSLYFSIVTFTTLGFGDVVAGNDWARVLVAIEVILGYLMLGGLISILSNKLARRS